MGKPRKEEKTETWTANKVQKIELQRWCCHGRRQPIGVVLISDSNETTWTTWSGHSRL